MLSESLAVVVYKSCESEKKPGSQLCSRTCMEQGIEREKIVHESQMYLFQIVAIFYKNEWQYGIVTKLSMLDNFKLETHLIMGTHFQLKSLSSHFSTLKTGQQSLMSCVELDMAIYLPIYLHIL